MDWLTHAGYNNTFAVPRLVRFVNERIDAGEIPRDATLFMPGESKGHLLECRFLPDGSRYGQRWVSELLRAGGDYEKMRRHVREQGIEYLVWNYGYLEWCLRNTETDPGAMGYSVHHFEQFQETYVDVLYGGQRSGMGLGRLR